MIIIDIRNRGDQVTLTTLSKVYDRLTTTAPSSNIVTLLPDEIWVTKWQHEHIFSSMGCKWEYWRGIPIKSKETVEELIEKSEG